MAFLKCGTLDKSTSLDRVLKPDIHIFTRFKQPWVVCNSTEDDRTKVAEEFYDFFEHWPEESLERFKMVREKGEKWEQGGSKWEEAIEILSEGFTGMEL